MKINEVNAPLFRSEKELQDERVKKVFFDKITSQLTTGLEQQLKAGTVTAATQTAPATTTDPFAAKRAQAAAAARANMASNPAPMPKPGPQPTAENKFYKAVNAIFESIINIDEAQPATTGPISISQYIEQAFVHFMNNPVFKTPAVSQIVTPLAKKVEDTYATDKGKAAIQELVDFGYNTLYKLKNSTGTAVPNNRNTSNAGNAQSAETSKFGQAISIIDQLSPKQKKKILAYINNELSPTAAAPNSEKVSIGGQEIKPGDPLYDKIKGNLD